jgi:hypothetical protein
LKTGEDKSWRRKKEVVCKNACKNDTGESCKQGGGAMNASEIAIVGFFALLIFVVIYCIATIILMRRKISFGERGIYRSFDNL